MTACPHALELAIPLVVAISTAMGAEHGILVLDRLALEEARKLDIIVFDKTGTLTEGKFGIVAIEAENEKDKDNLNKYIVNYISKSNGPRRLVEYSSLLPVSYAS